MDRDLEAAADGSETVRFSYGLVFDRTCATASLVAAVLQRRGVPAAGQNGVSEPSPSATLRQ
ncbi:hypothetical protein NPS01_25920 [Nocardioides psychrotolerans]|uniref:Uncharacterized protein n=1 Tax=Nocardioides psychrotolerans TaxID=1005945 RepID=A0A1I3LV33_9ACTN|nr:hypothetical protein [Nocardioides psychrotolerans]GEP38929.1 hypothetical protein NPS01_25920 [Nocardioides psychrotolerans]SFI88628.1 hypothetical protein SAMN05216561_114100 [Nocardioides psychrotolerans]